MVVQGSLTEGGRLSMVDLLVPTSLDQLLFIMKILFRCFTKQATLLRRSTVRGQVFNYRSGCMHVIH
jgi:hypothetical protein